MVIRENYQPQPNGLAYPRVWQGIGWLMVAIVVWLSLVPQPPVPPEFLAWDKAQHFVAYAGLMFWFRQSFQPHWRWPAFLIGLGIGLEYLQGLSGVRMLDPFDMLANSIGVLLGLLLCATPLGRLVPLADLCVVRWRPALMP